MTSTQQDDEVEATLRRVAEHLTRRGSEYLERPMQPSSRVEAAPFRYRRILLGAGAATSLCVAALVGSFIGGTSSGGVDVAEAAWSAVPAAPTAEQIEKARLDCGISASTLATIENVPPASIPDYMLEPSLVDVRGTTTTAVYFTWRRATLCVQFGDGSITLTQVPMIANDEFVWERPAVVEVEVEDTPATMIVGFLPPNVTGSDPNSTGESDSIVRSSWDVFVEGPGIERTKASVNGVLGRFVAWVPATGNWTINFVDSRTQEERTVGIEGAEDFVWEINPQTTVTMNADAPLTTGVVNPGIP